MPHSDLTVINMDFLLYTGWCNKRIQRSNGKHWHEAHHCRGHSTLLTTLNYLFIYLFSVFFYTTQSPLYVEQKSPTEHEHEECSFKTKE